MRGCFAEGARVLERMMDPQKKNGWTCVEDFARWLYALEEEREARQVAFAARYETVTRSPFSCVP